MTSCVQIVGTSFTTQPAQYNSTVPCSDLGQGGPESEGPCEDQVEELGFGVYKTDENGEFEQVGFGQPRFTIGGFCHTFLVFMGFYDIS